MVTSDGPTDDRRTNGRTDQWTNLFLPAKKKRLRTHGPTDQPTDTSFLRVVAHDSKQAEIGQKRNFLAVANCVCFRDSITVQHSALHEFAVVIHSYRREQQQKHRPTKRQKMIIVA